MISDDAARAIYAIAPTQFTADGRVDAAAIRKNVERLAGSGIRDTLLTGAYGEFQSLTDDERVEIAAAVAAAGIGRVMACAALPSTVATADLANRLAAAGASEIMVSPPMIAELTDADVMRHFEELAARVDAPLVIYNNPIFGLDLRADQLGAIAQIPGFVAIKQGTKAPGGVAATIEAVRASGMRVLGASDLVAADALLAGAAGFTSTNSWVFPDAFAAIGRCAGTAEHDLAVGVRAALAPYVEVVRTLGQPRTVKAAMRLRGYAGSGVVRLPYVELGDDEMVQVAEALDEADAALEAVWSSQ